MARIGELLASMRKACLLSQAAAAAHIGISETALRRIEDGVRDPSYSTIQKLVTKYGIDPRLLFPRENDPNVTEQFGAALRALCLPPKSTVRILTVVRDALGEQALADAAKGANFPWV